MAQEANHSGTTEFSKSYDQKVRPFIDLIDKLRSHGLDEDVHLPAIAVIGDQSSGKSSVLEAISGVQLPRGSGTVTRCPLELRLKRSDENGFWVCNIKYTDKIGTQVNRSLQSADQVGMEVLTAQRKMIEEADGISDGLITLDIESDVVPDLTLIDLPGIVRVAVGAQPQDISTKIKQLITKFVSQQQTIILAVIPCNVDIATTEALLVAKEMDRTKERTLGVLTKSDLVGKGTEEAILKTLRNEAYPLVKGYIMVKCRSQEDIDNNKSLAKAMQEEEEFFRNHEIFSHRPSQQWGIKSLSEKLTEIQLNQIKSSIPRLRREVKNILECTEHELKEMGTAPPDTKTEKADAHFLMVRPFLNDLKSISEGDYSRVKIKDSDENNIYALRLRTYAWLQFEEYYEKVMKFMPECNDSDLNNEIKDRISEQRGREMSNFSKYSIFEEFAKGLVLKPKEPAKDLLKCIVREQDKLVDLLSKHYFSKYDAYYKEMWNIICTYMKEVTTKLENKIDSLFEMEMEICCRDKPYLKALHAAEEEAPEVKRRKTENTFETSSSEDVPLNTDEVGKYFNSLIAFYKVASSRISEYVPMIIVHKLFTKSVENLEKKLTTMCLNDGILDLIREDEQRSLRRMELNEKIQRLQIADEELAAF